MKASRDVVYSQSLTAQKNICVDFMKAYQEQKVDQMIALSSSNSTVHFVPLGDQGKGEIRGLGRDLWTLLIKCFPDINNTVHSMSAEDDGIKCKVSIRGTQQADFFAIPNKGAHFDCEHIFVFQLNDEHHIEHLDVSWDHDEFVRQLNA